MFMGEYNHALDNKGRIIVPSKFRKELGESFVLTRGLDNCIFVYPHSEWKQLEEKLKSLPLTKSDARAFSRFFLSGATECALDNQGRIQIPENLRNHANLNKDVVVIGVSSRLEIWSKEEWDKYQGEAKESFENIAEEIVDFDI